MLCPMGRGQTLARGATFGRVIPIGGHAADIALDEARSRLYVANFTANRIEVISTADNSRQTPIIVPPQPGTLALSPDGRYLVVGHYNTFDRGLGPDSSPEPLRPAITILDLQTGVRRWIPRDPVPSFWRAPEPYPPDPSPLAIAFGNGPQALVISNRQQQGERLPRYGPSFQLLDPASGILTPLAVQRSVDSTGAPVPFATFPHEITEAAAGVSGDGEVIYFQARVFQPPDEFDYYDGVYTVSSGALAIGRFTSSPAPGPVLISVDRTGSTFLSHWTLLNSNFVLLAQFPYPTGRFNVGSYAIDTSRNLIYAHMPTPTEISSPPGTLNAPGEDGPVLTILDSDNLTVRERIRIPESLAGKSLLNGTLTVMYSASDSGVMVLPIGSLAETHRITAVQEDVVFLSNACDRGVITREIDIVNPGGGSTDFTLSTTALGVRITPSIGTTPARLRIEVDPTLYQNQHGTTAEKLRIDSSGAINIPFPVRLLINTREPDQRGIIVNVPGKLVDILADPVRDRFYILRQDKNLVLVLDGTTLAQIATLRTGNTPTQMALTADGKHLLVGNDNSQIANVYDLDLLAPTQFIVFRGGFYPRSIAVSKKAILAAVRSAGLCLRAPEDVAEETRHCIVPIDVGSRTAFTPFRTLGIYKNDINIETVMTASPSGENIFIAMPDGTLVLYEAVADTFVASRKDLGTLAGAYAALTDGLFVAENKVVNQSLVPIAQMETGTGSSTGMTLFEGFGLRTTSPSLSAPGVIRRVDLATFASLQPIRMAESPLWSGNLRTAPIGPIGQTILPFLRTLATLSNRTSIVSLTTSGFTVLPRDFDVGQPTPSVDRIVNLADQAQGVAPGGLVSVLGSNFSNATAVSTELPLPTTLSDLCLAVNNVAVPLLMVSPNRIDAQLLFNVVGSANLVVNGPSGASSPLLFTSLPGAPAVFQTGTAGPLTGLPAVYRATNNEVVTLTNPVHPKDTLIIFATGLGLTTPAVEAGAAAPFQPLAVASLGPAITLGGVPLSVSFAGLVPGLVGVYQINAFVPDAVPEGMDLPLTLGQGTSSTTLSVRVVR